VNTKICQHNPDGSANPDCTHLTEWIGSIHRLSAPAPCSVKGASTLPVVPSWNGEGVLFRETQLNCDGMVSPLKTAETPTFTPTLLLVSSRKNQVLTGLYPCLRTPKSTDNPSFDFRMTHPASGHHPYRTSRRGTHLEHRMVRCSPCAIRP
jgi:hypothetical protein